MGSIKLPPDLIEVSLKKRVSAPGGSFNTVVPNKDAKSADVVIFKLKLAAPIPELKAAPRDPTLGFMNAESAELRRRSTLGTKKTDEIEASLDERMKDGNSHFH